MPPACSTFQSSSRTPKCATTCSRCLPPAGRQSARSRMVTRAQRADAQQSTRPAPAQQKISKAAERSPEETAARQRFEARAGQDSGDQGLRKALLNSALALLEEAAATRKVMLN